MTTTIAVIRPEDEIRIVAYPTPFVTLDHLREGIFGDGEVGLVESHSANRITLWVDREARDRPWVANHLAQFVYEMFLGDRWPSDAVAGPAIFTGKITEDGDAPGLTDDQVARILFLGTVD